MLLVYRVKCRIITDARYYNKITMKHLFDISNIIYCKIKYTIQTLLLYYLDNRTQ